ncbi:MAG: peptidylprolyl isomerase [Anaerosomatales bacterium]|nr:peptidylprolyl isomerase [Anaerosomatales bacterium]
MRVRTRIAAAAAALALIVTAAGCGSGGAVAKVNGEKITREEFDSIVTVAKKQDTTLASLKEGDPMLLQYKRMILDSMIEAVLVRQEAKRLGIKVTDKDIDAKLAEIKASYPDENSFNEVVKQSGMTMEQIRQSISDQLIYQALYDKVAPAPKISEDQIKKYYEDNKSTQFSKEPEAHLQHILFAENDKATAEKVLKEIQGGADFGALAAKYSTDPGSKNSGGDLGSAPTSRYVKEFQEAADKLKVGEVSGLVKSQFGWHIIKKLGETPGGIQPYEEVKDLIKSTLEQEARTKTWNDYLAKLKEKAKIEILDKQLAEAGKAGSSEATAK